MYLLSPALFLSDPLDTPDQRYLNYEHAPIVHPLKKALKIEMYNGTDFTKPPPTHLKQQIDKPYNPIDQYLQTEHKIKFPSTHSLHLETKTTPHDIIDHTIDKPILPQTTNLDDRIKQSKDKIFFVSYIPEGTLRARWYLIQVELNLTFKTNPAHKFNHKYYCISNAKHDSNKKKSNEYSRWWPGWWTYTIDPSSNIHICQQRIPCTYRNMLPPTLGSQTSHQPSIQK